MCSSVFLNLGPSSDSDLTSLAVETDSLADLDDGMASGRTSPNHPQGGATILTNSPRLPSLHDRRSPSPTPTSSTPNPEVRPGRLLLFSGSLRKVSVGTSKDVKSEYLDRASELILLAVQKEKEQDFHTAFSCYRNGVDLLLQGVQGELRELGGNSFHLFPFQTCRKWKNRVLSLSGFSSGEPSPTTRETVKKKTAEYLMRAEQIANQHLKSSMGQGSTQTVRTGITSSQKCLHLKLCLCSM